MNRTVWMVAVTVALGMSLALWSVPMQAGGEKAPAWKPFLPDRLNGKLIAGSLTRLSKLADDDKGSVSALRAEALILAGHTLSFKDSESGAPIRNTAAKVATLAAASNGAPAARRLASALADGIAEDAGPVKDWRVVIGDISDVMNLLASKAKKGEGLHADLQYNDKIKKQNGIEQLINALAAKKLTDANLGKMSGELELLGYRVATIGALTLRRGPAEKKKGVEDRLWDEQAIVMRDAAVELAEGAGKKDGAAVFEAAKRLETSCVECHRDFK